MIPVLIALQEPLLRIGIHSTIDADEEFQVVGSVESGEELLAEVSRLAPRILLLDVHYRDQRPDILKTLAGEYPQCRVVVMVDHADTHCTLRALLREEERFLDESILQSVKECCVLALRESARGCLAKNCTPEQLLTALRSVAAGEVWTGKGLADAMMDSLRMADDRKTGLSAREIEIIGLVTEGLGNKEIADRLSLSEQTVKNHIARIMEKLHVRNRVELAILAVKKRLA